MLTCKKSTTGSGRAIDRRRFLQLTAGGLAWLATGIKPAGASAYRVGVGRSSDPYAATLRAVDSTGEWPLAEIAGKTVAIKPNLVVPMPSDTGVTTDPEVVRALVDRALQAGAVEVVILEGGYGGANFSGCGYDFFHNYHPRVKLVDLNNETISLAKVPNGMAYGRIYLANLLLRNDVVFISAAKLKTHSHTHATLSLKNLVGLAPINKYVDPGEELLLVMHRRGISQVIVDLNLLRPVDFAVVDGVWAMEGEGPGLGDPVSMDMVVAGRNAVAVDRVCLWVSQLPQQGVMHLTYATRKGLGPGDMSEIQVLGDPFMQRAFTWPSTLPPLIEYPRVFPAVFAPKAGQEAAIFYWLAPFPCSRRVEVVRTSDITPVVTHIRLLRDWDRRPPGFEMLKWDGRNDAGQVVSPGRYTVRVQAKYSNNSTHSYGTGLVWVAGS